MSIDKKILTIKKIRLFIANDWLIYDEDGLITDKPYFTNEFKLINIVLLNEPFSFTFTICNFSIQLTHKNYYLD